MHRRTGLGKTFPIKLLSTLSKLSMERLMPEADPRIRIVLTTAACSEAANQLACALVEDRLAACATIIPGAQSVYHWQGKVETAAEFVVLIKTTVDLLPPLETRLLELHTYQTPEFLVLPVESGSRQYLDWLHTSLGEPAEVTRVSKS
jgi:periplasmic divalent cation tolerance protein